MQMPRGMRNGLGLGKRQKEIQRWCGRYIEWIVCLETYSDAHEGCLAVFSFIGWPHLIGKDDGIDGVCGPGV